MTASSRFNNELRYREGDHPGQTHFTPGYILDPVRQDLGGAIGLDPCTTSDNPTGAERFFALPVDGLRESWAAADSIYVNPPYGAAREPWVRRCAEVGLNHPHPRVVLLIPAHTDTRIFQWCVRTADAIVLIQGRVKFGVLRPNRRQVAASHPSALIGWNTSLDACARLGAVITRRAVR